MTDKPQTTHPYEEFGRRLRSAIKHNDTDEGVGKEIYTWGFADAVRIMEKCQKAEYGWLIEMKDKTGKPLWLILGEQDFTDDSIKATRFSRREDAEGTIKHLGSINGLTATEHQWG